MQVEHLMYDGRAVPYWSEREIYAPCSAYSKEQAEAYIRSVIEAKDAGIHRPAVLSDKSSFQGIPEDVGT